MSNPNVFPAAPAAKPARVEKKDELMIIPGLSGKDRMLVHLALTHTTGGIEVPPVFKYERGPRTITSEADLRRYMAQQAEAATDLSSVAGAVIAAANTKLHGLLSNLAEVNGDGKKLPD